GHLLPEGEGSEPAWRIVTRLSPSHGEAYSRRIRTAGDGRADCRIPVANPVRFRDVVPHPVSGLHHWPGELAGVPGSALVAQARRDVARSLFLLDEGVCRLVRPGRGL